MRIDYRPILFTLIAFIIVLWALSSCGVQHHFKRMEHHKSKAIQKGAQIERDTVVQTLSDTLIFVETRNDTTFITKTVTNTITLEPEIIVKDRWQVRTETKWRVKEIKIREKADVKKAIQATKKARAERSKCKGWVWLLTGAIVALIARNLLFRFVLTKYDESR